MDVWVSYRLDGGLVVGEDSTFPRWSACYMDVEYHLQSERKALELRRIHGGGPG
jgi:hypothetical protein